LFIIKVTFKKINGKRVKSASGLLEDYWFGHRIQHGSGDQVNVTITAGYELGQRINSLKLVKLLLFTVKH
jgi:hypothetical protein